MAAVSMAAANRAARPQPRAANRWLAVTRLRVENGRNRALPAPARGLLIRQFMQRHGADGGGWASGSLLRETRGAVLVEYVAALSLAIAIAAATVVAHGRFQMPSDDQRREALSQPYP